MITFLTSWAGGCDKIEGKRIPARIAEANGFLDKLKTVWPDDAKVIMICADPDDIGKNDSQLACFRESLPMSGLPVSQVLLCDGRNEGIADEISGCDVIILTGGHVPTQNAFMKRIGLKEKLQGFDGIVFAWSAGSMNCADPVYASPELPGEAAGQDFKRWISGLGLTKTNIYPHYQMLKDDVLDGMKVMEDITYPDSMVHDIIALNDGSYIIAGDEGETLYGEAYLISNGKIRLICRDGESVRI